MTLRVVGMFPVREAMRRSLRTARHNLAALDVPQTAISFEVEGVDVTDHERAAVHLLVRGVRVFAVTFTLATRVVLGRWSLDGLREIGLGHVVDVVEREQARCAVGAN